MLKPSVSFFCPAYYDQDNIRNTVTNVVGTLEEVAENFDITIVEDGSPDNTAQAADRLAEEDSRKNVPHNPGSTISPSSRTCSRPGTENPLFQPTGSTERTVLPG